MKPRTDSWRVGAVGLCIMMALCIFLPVAAQAGIEVTRNESELDYPDTITFRVAAQSDADIERVILTYGTSARSCQGGGATQPIQFSPNSEIELDWTWEFKRSGNVPPGATVWWEWQLTDTDGNSHTSERRELRLIDDGHEWREVSDEAVTVYWYAGDTNFGEETLEAALESLEQISGQIGVWLTEEIQLWLYPSSEEVREAITLSQDWAGALAFPDYNVMIIGLAPGQSNWAEDVIPHELAHLVVGAASFNCRGGRLPVWLSEGLSVASEGAAFTEDLERLETALQEETLLPLPALSDGFSAYGSGARLAYAHSGEAVRYLLEEFGAEQMSALLTAIGGGMTPDNALEETYGFDTGGLDARWRQSQGYAPTPTSPAAAAQAAATPTSVPTLALVGQPAVATQEATEEPPTTTPLPTLEPASAVLRSPTATVAAQATEAEAVAAAPAEPAITPAPTPARESDSGQSAPGNLLLITGIVIAAVLLIGVGIAVFRKGA